MANFEKMIPFILYCEEGLKKSVLKLSAPAIYAEARKKGVHNDPADQGGATMCGVTLSTYKEWRKKHGFPTTTLNDLRNMPYFDWLSILKETFWNRWSADEIRSEAVAYALVDWVWTSGKYGITRPQRLVGVNPDGVVGPKTLAAINGYPDQRRLFDMIQADRKDYHERIVRNKPSQAKFLRGWQKRVDRITWEGFNYD